MWNSPCKYLQGKNRSAMRIFNTLFLSISLLTTTAFAQTPPNPTPLFSPAERARIVGFWNAAGRYQSGPDLPQDGKRWVTRLTPAASIWFRAYTRALSGVALSADAKRRAAKSDAAKMGGLGARQARIR